MKSKIVQMLSLVLLAVLVLGCTGMGSFSAEDAAVQFGIEMMEEGAAIDYESIEVRQVREIGDAKYVLFTFNRQVENRNERCMMLYQTRRTPLQMWNSGSGGGGCGGAGAGFDEVATRINAGAGTSTDSDHPLGTSQAYGEVNDAEIAKVRVTWNDGAVFDADLVNNSYLVMRDGQFELTMIEGLDADGAVLEKLDWGRPAPGKE